jgi:hypothetical protein
MKFVAHIAAGLTFLISFATEKPVQASPSPSEQLQMCGHLFRDADNDSVILRGKHSYHLVLPNNAAAAEKLMQVTIEPSFGCVLFSRKNWHPGEFVLADKITDGPTRGGITISN